MEKINSQTNLRKAILELEQQRTGDGKVLKEHFYLAYESIKPINLIKSTFKQAAESPDIQNNIINRSVGLTAGYLSKKLFEGASHHPLKKLVGTALLFGITNAVANNPEAVKALGKGLLNMMRSKSRKHAGENGGTPTK